MSYNDSYRIFMTLFLLYKTLINHDDYISIMSLYLKHTITLRQIQIGFTVTKQTGSSGISLFVYIHGSRPVLFQEIPLPL